MYDYTQKDIVNTLKTAGIQKGDTIFTHSNLCFFGVLESACSQMDYLKAFHKAFMECLGENGTLCVPTFTYSFCNNNDFTPETTPSLMGVFPEYIRQLPDTIRSVDANFSVAAIGKNAKKFCKVGEHSFGENSFWEHFLNANGKICNLNVDASSTFLHYVEKQMNVPYRYDKAFGGNIIHEGTKKTATFYHFVRHLDKPEWGTDAIKYHELAIKEGFASATPLGRGAVYTSSTTDIWEYLEKAITANPYFLTVSGTSS